MSESESGWTMEDETARAARVRADSAHSPSAAERVAMLELRPDDIIVITSPDQLSEATIDRIRNGIREHGITNLVMVVERAELSILRPMGEQR